MICVKINYKGVEIERVRFTSTNRYYVHWVSNLHYSAPHFEMSEAMRSLKRAKNFVDRLLIIEMSDPTIAVTPFGISRKMSIHRQERMERLQAVQS